MPISNSDQDSELLHSVIGFIGSARGGRKKGAPLSVVLDREVTAQDIAKLADPAPVGVGTPAVKELRHSHHLVARLLAEGRRPIEVSQITGMCQSRISILRGDPAFQELISYYAGQAEAQYVDVHSRLATLGIDTIEELQRRVQEEGAELSPKLLLAIGEFALDRSVAPTKRGGDQGNTGGNASAPVINIAFVGPNEQFSLPPAPASSDHAQAKSSLSFDLDLPAEKS